MAVVFCYGRRLKRPPGSRRGAMRPPPVANEWPWSKSAARKRAIADFGYHNRTARELSEWQRSKKTREAKARRFFGHRNRPSVQIRLPQPVENTHFPRKMSVYSNFFALILSRKHSWLVAVSLFYCGDISAARAKIRFRTPSASRRRRRRSHSNSR